MSTEMTTTGGIAPIRAALAKAEASFAAALPATVKRYLTPERLTKIALAAMSRSPQLMDCTPESILRAVMDAATLGLEPGGPLGQAYLVPYKNKGRAEAQLIVGYRGLIALARRSGQIESVTSNVVYSRDSLKVDLASGTVEHAPYMPEMPPEAEFFAMDDAAADELMSRGRPIAVYCVARFVGGGHHLDLMTMAEVDAVRRRSRAGESGPWVTDYLEMARKTVVRRAAKYWPLSTELTDALAAEDERAGPITVREVAAPQLASGTFGFAKKREAAPAATQEPVGQNTSHAEPSPDWPDVPAFDAATGEVDEAPQKRQTRKPAREPGSEG